MGRASPIDTLPLLVAERRFVFRGDSMLPLLEDGDEVWARPVEAGRLAPGDLVVFGRFKGGAWGLVVHRLVEAGRTLVTRGDACRRADGPLDPSRVVGRAVCLRRRGAFVDLSSARGRLLERACRLYAALALAWWWEAMPSSAPPAARLARALVLAVPRLLWKGATL